MKYMDISCIHSSDIIPSSNGCETWDEDFYATFDGSSKDYDKWKARFYPEYLGKTSIKTESEHMNLYNNVWLKSRYSKKSEDATKRWRKEIEDRRLAEKAVVDKEVESVMSGSLEFQLEYIFGKTWKHQIHCLVRQAANSTAKEFSRFVKNKYG